MLGWLFGKKGVSRVEEDTKKGFESVRKDIVALTGWIKHLDSERNFQHKEIGELKESLSSIREEVDGLKNVFAIMNEIKPAGVFKTPKQLFNKQTPVYGVQTGVQTGDETLNLDNFSVTERAILWILINSDMRLSYDDLATMLGRERSTIRGQINRIKQKREGLIKEVIENNGKKRVYVEENLKEKLIKKSKVRLKKDKKNLENSES